MFNVIDEKNCHYVKKTEGCMYASLNGKSRCSIIQELIGSAFAGVKRLLKGPKKVKPLSNKNLTRVSKFTCAQDWIRTSTSLRTPPPQSGLSTSFNTWARKFTFSHI
jgi:hypothetical protein